jgi:Flp pilus assembly protein TadG
MRAARGTRGNWTGQSVVEFALSSLLLLSLIFGTIDLGRIVFLRTMVTNAVREAARQGAITPGSNATIAAAAAARSPTLGLTTSNFTVTCDTWTGTARTCASGSTSPPSVIQLERITVCANYTINVIVTRIIRRSSLTITECEQASVR